MMRKIGQMVKSMVSIASDDEADGLKGDYDDETTMIEGQERLISLRENLVAAIATNEASTSSDIVKNLVESGTGDFRMKYAMLDVKQLLEINSQSMIQLQNIVSGLSLIAKYAQNLLKQDQPIQSIPLSNPHVQKKIVPFNGSMYILDQLGYSHQTEKALSFPPDTDPDHRIIVNLLADMLLFKAEMRYFLTGSHKDSQQIEALLPSHTLAELHGGNGSSQEFLDTSVQSLDLGKTKTSGSDSSSVYYSAQSGGSSNKDSLSEFSPKEGTLHEEEEEGMLPEEVEEGAESKPLQRPKEIVTMQDYAVEEIGGSDTSSLKTPSSGFKLSCTLCNEEAQTLCRACQNKLLCNACDTDWHSHWARRNHDRELISDLDPNALPSVSDNIVRGVYGIIAQTENPVALISKKIQAAASKSKDAHDGEPGEDKNGNVPDFGSIMSGNLEPFADDRTKNSQQQQQKPKLLTRGGSEEKKVFKDRGGPAARGFGPPQIWQQQQQQHQQQHGELNQQPLSPLQQHDLPQFLQEGGGGGVGGNNEDNNFGDVQYHPYPHALQQHQQYQYYNNPPLPPTSSVPMSMQPPSPFSSTYPIPQSQPWLVHSQSAAPRAQSQPIVSVVPGQPPIYMQGQNALPGQGTRFQVPSVSNPLVHSHPSGIYGPVRCRAPYAQSPGQPMNMTSKGHVDPLPHQIPPVSSSQNFQQFGGDLNYNQSSASAAQHVYSMTQQQQQQQQHPLFRAPTNVQMYNANSGQWRYYTPEYRPSTTPVGEPQRWYHSSNQNQDNSPDSSPTTARHKVASPVQTTNSCDVMGPHHHQSMPQQYQQQPQQQQQGLPQSHLQNYPDKEETFVQYPSQLRMPTPMTNNVPYQIPQVQSTQFAPKQSQTYPQLSTIATASLNEEQSRPQPQQQRQQQKQKASRQLLHTSQSTPALSSANNPAAKIIHRIKSEPLASTRQSLCSFKIDELTGEIDDLSKEIDDHLLDDDDAALSTQIEVLTKRKKELLKTKKELVKYFREIENSADDSLEVFFPPSSGSSLQQVQQQSLPVSLAERAKSGMRRTPTKEIPEVGVENVARVESAKILSKKSDFQAGHPQHQHQHHRHSPPLLFEPSFPGSAESTVENASHKQPSPPRMEPPQISLKEDKSSPESSSKLKWYCGHCTYLNEMDSQHCVLCHKTTDHKKYYREDGIEETMESEQLVPDLQDGNRGSPQQNDFVAEVVARNRILSMQKEEEKMMEKKISAKITEYFWIIVPITSLP